MTRRLFQLRGAVHTLAKSESPIVLYFKAACFTTSSLSRAAITCSTTSASSVFAASAAARRNAPEPIPGAIYVPAGDTPDYLIDRPSRTILIGDSRGNGEATRDDVRIAARKAIKKAFGN